jgi:hypothetical protein
MTDSPRLSLPIDPEERPIEGQLLQIRNKLELLKADKSNYVKSEDVMQMYEEVIVQVNALNKLRENKRDEQNRGMPFRRGNLLENRVSRRCNFFLSWTFMVKARPTFLSYIE